MVQEDKSQGLLGLVEAQIAIVAQMPDSVAGKSTNKVRASLERFRIALAKHLAQSRMQQFECVIRIPPETGGLNIRPKPSTDPDEYVRRLYIGDLAVTHQYIGNYTNPDNPEDVRGWYRVITLGDSEGVSNDPADLVGWAAIPEAQVLCLLPYVDYDAGGNPKLTAPGTMYIRCDGPEPHLWGTPSSDGVWGINMGTLPHGTPVDVLGSDFSSPNETWWRQIQVESGGENYVGWILLQNLVPGPCGNPTAASLRHAEGVVLVVGDEPGQITHATVEQLMGILDYEAGGNRQQIVDIAFVIQNRMRTGLSLNSVLNDPQQFHGAERDFAGSPDWGAEGGNAELLRMIINVLLADQDLQELDFSQYEVDVPGMEDIVYGLYTYATYVGNLPDGYEPSRQEILASLEHNTAEPECLCDVQNLIVGWTPLAGGNSTVIFRADAGCAEPSYWGEVIAARVTQKRAEGDQDYTTDDAIRELRSENCHFQY